MMMRRRVMLMLMLMWILQCHQSQSKLQRGYLDIGEQCTYTAHPEFFHLMGVVTYDYHEKDNDTLDDEFTPHIWILGDILKSLGELFDSVEVSSNPNVFHPSNRSNVLNMTNL